MAENKCTNASASPRLVIDRVIKARIEEQRAQILRAEAICQLLQHRVLDRAGFTDVELGLAVAIDLLNNVLGALEVGDAPGCLLSGVEQEVAHG